MIVLNDDTKFWKYFENFYQKFSKALKPDKFKDKLTKF